MIVAFINCAFAVCPALCVLSRITHDFRYSIAVLIEVGNDV